MNIELRMCIISLKIEEIAQYILHEICSGATLDPIVDENNHNTIQEIITIVDHQKYRCLMKYMKKPPLRRLWRLI